MQDPLSVDVGDAHRSLLVQADTPGVEYRGGQDRVGDGRQALCIKFARLGGPRVYAAGGVNEFLNGNVSVSPLAIKMAGFGWRVFHAEEKGATVSERAHAKENYARREPMLFRGQDGIDRGKVHVLERVVPGLAGVVNGHVVPPVCLVDVNVALRIQTIIVRLVENTVKQGSDPADLFTHIIPVLGGVDTGS